MNSARRATVSGVFYLGSMNKLLEYATKQRRSRHGKLGDKVTQEDLELAWMLLHDGVTMKQACEAKQEFSRNEEWTAVNTAYRIGYTAIKEGIRTGKLELRFTDNEKQAEMQKALK